MFRRFVSSAVAVAACALLVAPQASGGIRQRIAAANKVERVLTAKHPRYRWVAACDQRSRTRFDCSFVGRRGARSARGKAGVTRNGEKYAVKLGRVTFS